MDFPLGRASQSLFRPSVSGPTSEEEQQLKRAQLEKLHADKLQAKKAVLIVRNNGEPQVLELKKLGKYPTARGELLEHVLSNESGNPETGQLLRKIRDRFDKAGVPISDVLVRFKRMTVTGLVEIKTHKSPLLGDQLKAALKVAQSLVTGRPAGDVRELLVLDDVSGVLRPSRFTLLLGPPGCGKSSLMKAMAGLLTKDKTLKVTYEELTYNGQPLEQFVPERTAAYVSQVDQHFGEMTVRETLDFSARCQASRTRMSMMERLEAKEKELGITPDPVLAAYITALNKSGKQNMVTDLMLKTLGLDICAETLVGNAMLRGISGGQKKRVTSGEMMVGPAKVLFADEISTGLDSATTYDICRALRESCHIMQGTMLVSLLQPQPETFDLFDDVWVISSGKLVFQGPREFVLPFFSSLGFACPKMRGVADFLQEVNTYTDQENFWTGDPDSYQFVAAHQIAAAYYATEHGAAVIKELEAPTERQGHEELATHRYGQTWPTLLRANLRRQVILQKRNAAFIVIRIFQCILMGFACGTLFLNTSKNNLQDAQLFMAVGFFSVLIQLVGGFSSSAMMIDRLPVYYKQRDAHFYPAWCFALPELILQMPLIVAESWIWTLMVYYMVGFYSSVRILVFWGFMFFSGLWGLSLFMAVGALSRSHAVATAIQSFLMLVFLVASGFIANASDMPGGWIAAFYSNPLAWFIKGLLINELTTPDWSEPSSSMPGLTIGEEALINRGYPTTYSTVWIGLFAWGVGSSFVNFLLFGFFTTFLSSHKGTRAVAEEVVLERSLSKGGGLERLAKLASNAKSLSHSNLVALGNGHAATNVHADADGNGHAAHAGDIEEGGLGAKAGSPKGALPFKPLVMTFSNVAYSVPMPKGSLVTPCEEGPHSGQLLLLKGISGSFRPRVLTALMGASGAGKTTLMDVLALRKTGGKVTGEIMINGFPQNRKTFNRIMGYVEQTDVHIPEATVLEALLLSARLRLPSDVPDAVATKFVDEVLALVELTGISNAQIGMPGLSGLSVEQRKRLTIAVELVANPSIVFMDEPTSGLDARAASVVMRAVRNTVNTGRTVVCTIHQPSLDIFLAFDELLLLKRGGETIFNGPMGKDAQNLINYFSAIPNVPAFNPSYNPANWMLEVTSPDAEQATGINFAQRFANSELAESTAALIEKLSKPKEGDSDLRYEDMQVASSWRQAKELLRRNFQQYARKYDYNVTRLIITFVIGMLFGTLFINQGTATDTFNGVINVAGALYMSVLFMGILDCMMVQNVIVIRRSVYYREHAAGMYSVGPYIAAEFLVEVPYLVAQSVIYSLLVYWMIGFEATAGKFFFFLLIMVLSMMYWTYFGINNVHVTPAEELAKALAGFSFGFVNLFCGFLKPRSSIPKGWIWLYWINPMSYTLYALVVGQLGDNDKPMITTGGGASTTVSQFVYDFLGYEWGFRWWCILIMAGYSIFFFATCTLALKKLNWQNR